jgi:hypothetical protein
MSPNIFISSTIRDLHYLRDGLREAVEDLLYNPIMSDYGEIGYINPSTAAQSCYQTVTQCQVVVLIIGLRYGSVGADGLSVTHREFITARDGNIPLITFVDPAVLSYRNVYKANADEVFWSGFSEMDNPKSTFALIKDVESSSAYNGILAYVSVSDAKYKLKRQLAEFFAARLNDTVQPLRKEMQEVLAQVSALRQEMTKGGISDVAKKHLRAMRFLLDDRHADYRKLIELLYGDLDRAISAVTGCATFDSVVVSSAHKLECVSDDGGQDAIMPKNDPEHSRRSRFATYGGMMGGGFVLFSDGVLRMNQRRYQAMVSVHNAFLSSLNPIEA